MACGYYRWCFEKYLGTKHLSGYRKVPFSDVDLSRDWGRASPCH